MFHNKIFLFTITEIKIFLIIRVHKSSYPHEMLLYHGYMRGLLVLLKVNKFEIKSDDLQHNIDIYPAQSC